MVCTDPHLVMMNNRCSFPVLDLIQGWRDDLCYEVRTSEYWPQLLAVAYLRGTVQLVNQISHVVMVHLEFCVIILLLTTLDTLQVLPDCCKCFPHNFLVLMDILVNILMMCLRLKAQCYICRNIYLTAKHEKVWSVASTSMGCGTNTHTNASQMKVPVIMFIL